jgi:hypothetical protein
MSYAAPGLPTRERNNRVGASLADLSANAHLGGPQARVVRQPEDGAIACGCDGLNSRSISSA